MHDTAGGGLTEEGGCGAAIIALKKLEVKEMRSKLLKDLESAYKLKNKANGQRVWETMKKEPLFKEENREEKMNASPARAVDKLPALPKLNKLGRERSRTLTPEKNSTPNIYARFYERAMDEERKPPVISENTSIGELSDELDQRWKNIDDMANFGRGERRGRVMPEQSKAISREYGKISVIDRILNIKREEERYEPFDFSELDSAEADDLLKQNRKDTSAVFAPHSRRRDGESWAGDNKENAQRAKENSELLGMINSSARERNNERLKVNADEYAETTVKNMGRRASEGDYPVEPSMMHIPSEQYGRIKKALNTQWERSARWSECSGPEYDRLKPNADALLENMEALEEQKTALLQTGRHGENSEKIAQLDGQIKALNDQYARIPVLLAPSLLANPYILQYHDLIGIRQVTELQEQKEIELAVKQLDMSMRNAKTTEQYDWALQARSALVAKMGVSGELTGALEKLTRGATGLGYDIRAGLHGSEYSQQLDYLTSFEFMANADPAGYRAGKTAFDIAERLSPFGKIVSSDSKALKAWVADSMRQRLIEEWFEAYKENMER